MKGGMLYRYLLGEGEEHKPAAAAAATRAHPTGYSAAAGVMGLGVIFLSLAFAAFVLYVTAIYTDSWIEKLQMLPLCIVAVTAPMLWAIMFRKFHG